MDSRYTCELHLSSSLVWVLQLPQQTQGCTFLVKYQNTVLGCDPFFQLQMLPEKT